jgi:hypothetical protein
MRNVHAFSEIHWNASEKVWSPYVTKRQPWPWWTRHGRKVKISLGLFIGCSLTSILYHDISRRVHNFRMKYSYGPSWNVRSHHHWRKLNEGWRFWNHK